MGQLQHVFYQTINSQSLTSQIWLEYAEVQLAPRFNAKQAFAKFCNLYVVFFLENLVKSKYKRVQKYAKEYRKDKK